MSDSEKLVEWHHRVVEVVNEGVVIVQDGEIVLANGALAKMLGYRESELTGMLFVDVVDPIFHRHGATTLAAMSEGTCRISFRTRLLRHDGRPIHVEVTPTPVLYNGRPATLAAVRDLSRELDLESTVGALEERFASLYNLSPAAYFTLDSEGVVRQVNREAEHLLGVPEEQIVGRHLEEFLPEPPGDYDVVGEFMREVLMGKHIQGVEIEMLRPDGRRLWVSVSSRPLSKIGAHAEETAFMAFDITRRKAAEARVLEERQWADLYLGVMTNDLNVINQSTLYSLELVTSTVRLPDKTLSVLRETAWNVRRSSRMIANVRALITLRKSPPEKRRTNLYAHFQRARREADRDFEWKTLEVETNIEDGKFFVVGHQFLWSVFFNIMHNAMMYDPEKHVRMEVTAEYVDNGSKVRVSFADHGPGIPDSMKEELMDRARSPERHAGGAGLGLTFVYRFIRDLGGDLWVEDRVPGDHSKGAKFVVEIPAWVEEAEAATILFYKSAHCVFCGPVYESLMAVLDEMGMSRNMVRVIDVDDPNAGVSEDELPALPTIRFGQSELTGFVSEDDLREHLMTMLMFSQ